MIELLAGIALWGLTPADSSAEPAPSEAEAFDPPAGPWRQLIRYRPREGRSSGISLWIEEAAIVPEGAEPPARTRTPREAYELWINHGAGIVAGQRFRIVRVRHHCGEGEMVRLAQEAYSEYAVPLAWIDEAEAPQPVLPHAAEGAARRAVCDSGTHAREGARAETLGEALDADPIDVGLEAPQPRLQVDLDADGAPERLEVRTRADDGRVDIRLVPGRGADRAVDIVAADQPSAGWGLRLVPPGTYLYACERREGRDVEPCRRGAATVVRGGAEMSAPGQPALLLWAPGGEPRIVRLPDEPPPPMPISHHDRPPTPVIGTYYVGRLREACGGGRLPDGRAYRDQPHRFETGDRFGISLASPDAPLTLQVLRADAPDQPVVTVEARGDGERAAAMVEVGDARDFVLRVIGGPDSADARWRVELSFDRPIDSVYFSDFFDWGRADAACR